VFNIILRWTRSTTPDVRLVQQILTFRIVRGGTPLPPIEKIIHKNLTEWRTGDNGLDFQPGDQVTVGLQALQSDGQKSEAIETTVNAVMPKPAAPTGLAANVEFTE
jgi:hypothetical protein